MATTAIRNLCVAIWLVGAAVQHERERAQAERVLDMRTRYGYQPCWSPKKVAMKWVQ
jgi:hypothetical protein